MKQIFYFILVLLFVKATPLQAQPSDPHLLPKAQNFMQGSGTALAFEENKGQVQGKDGDKVRFTVKAPGIDIFILNDGIAYQYKKVHYPEGYAEQLKDQEPEQMERLAAAISTETYRMDALLVGANPNAAIETEGRATAVTHYYNHNALDVSQYQKVIFKNIYPLIDWQLVFKNGQLEYEFVVHPGGNPEQIRFRYEHTEGLALQKDGSLQLQSKMGNITDQAPISFQDGRSINTAFVLEGKEMHFKLSPYDLTKKLIIDPTLVWATYYGGELTDEGRSCATDAEGNVYLAGLTLSTTAISGGGYQNVAGGNGDAFLVKFNSIGTRLWATYYGGTTYDLGNSCATDASGNVYLAGYSGSNGLAVNGHQNTWAGGNDAFLVKFNSNGIRIWATYYGGPSLEYGNGCATDPTGNVYLVGVTHSAVNIAFSGHQNSIGGLGDAFVVKFDSNGVRQWGTYYGGTGSERFQGCAADPAGNVFLAGETNSTSNIAHNAHQSNLGGFFDAFLVKLNSSGVRQWGTYYGGSSPDYGYDCAIDALGNVYLAGEAGSQGGVSGNGHQNSIGGASDAFLAKFDSNGVRLWGTYYGGGAADNARSCAVDVSGNVFIAGSTSSSSGIALGGVQNMLGGNGDAYCAKFNNAGVLQWGSYYGGSTTDLGLGCATDAAGHLYLSGQTQSLENIASGGYQNAYNGGAYDAFLAKLSIESNPLPLTLTDFTATAAKDKTQLSWATAKEVNVQTISVERSNEKTTQWETIAIQNAKGGLRNRYEDWDQQPLNGINLYRLKMTDIDGTFTHSAVRKVYFDRTSDNHIRIYPNPSKGTFTIEFDQSPNGTVNVRIADVLGRSVYEENYEGTKRTIADLKLNAGVYLVRIQYNDHVYTEKMIIE